MPVCTGLPIGGSVIGFAGDAISCWFAEADDLSSAALRATTCALAMQTAMHQLAAVVLPSGSTAALALKVALASGAARRFVVDDPSIQMLDVLAGVPLARTAAGEHLAAKGEVVIDEAMAQALGDQIQIAAWRVDEETSERFAVVSTNDERPTMNRAITSSPPHPLTLSAEQLRPWLLPAVFERHTAGLGDFLTELRPAVALFLRFAGIDPQDNAAIQALDLPASLHTLILSRIDQLSAKQCMAYFLRLLWQTSKAQLVVRVVSGERSHLWTQVSSSSSCCWS